MMSRFPLCISSCNGQQTTLIESCSSVMVHQSRLVRRWACLCVAQLLRSSPGSFIQVMMSPEALSRMVNIAKNDEASDSRMAAVSALGALAVNLLTAVATNEAGVGSNRQGHRRPQDLLELHPPQRSRQLSTEVSPVPTCVAICTRK